MDIEFKDLIIAFEKDPKEVRDYFESLGIVLSDDWEDFLKQFEKDAFKIAGVNNANHLMDAKKLISDAIANGTPLSDFKKQFRQSMNLRAWHADLVVTQNISNAYNGGRFQQQSEDVDYFPYLQPITMNDKKSTPGCKWLDEQNICFKIKDKNLKLMYSPRHFHCRTIYVSITEKQREREGLTVKEISTIPKKYLNAPEFRKLPNTAFEPDLSGFPKELKEKIKQ
ncbi:MAG: phage head morphogenesis protein [Candidatus Kapabacteria bacterium]|nr:phage head morphogenesis protein [Candidatus Kapabacteria bacterium]